MPKGRPRGASDLMRPPLRVRAISNAYGLPPTAESPEGAELSPSSASFSFRDLPNELLTAILLPLPYLASGLLNSPEIKRSHAGHSNKLETAEEVLEEVASTALPVPTRASTLIQACILTAGTLLVVGLLGRTFAKSIPLDRRKQRVPVSKDGGGGVDSYLSASVLKKVALRIVKIGLPFLATIEIGGMRTSMVLLSAAAGGLFTPDTASSEQAPTKPWKRAVKNLRFTCVVIVISALCDIFWLRKDADPASLIRGYVALAKAVLFLQPPYATIATGPSRMTIQRQSSFGGTAISPTNAWSTSARVGLSRRSLVFPMVSSPAEIDITLMAGGFLGIVALLLSVLFTASPHLTVGSILLTTGTIASASAAFLVADPSSLQSPLKIGYVLGLCIAAARGIFRDSRSLHHTAAIVGITLCSYIAMQLDTRKTLANITRGAADGHHAHVHYGEIKASKFTHFLLRRTETMPLAHSILLDKESRRIVYFMSINFLFMFIQTFYALASGSLGLLSDSIHMFFDCVGLLAGLVAAMMSKWPPNAQFPYGYGKVGTLSGLGNGIFLMIISVEIIWESSERFMEGAELRRINELILVSVGGLVVNLLGLKFIGHHHHGHGHGDDHAHAHGHTNGHAHHEHDHHSHEHNGNGNDAERKNSGIFLDVPNTTQPGLIGNPAEHHHHDHGNENMAGIYLHILADTMGSVAVIVSAILISYTGWSGWDPIASFIIAVLIIAASIPLVFSSARKLLLTVPADMEYTLRSALQELSGMRGVAGYAVPRFWMNDEEAGLGEDHAHHDHSHVDHHDHSHDHHDHSHDHSHDHANGKDTEKSAANHDHHHHGHAHSHTHAHTPPTPSTSCYKILGVIHIIALPNADLEDVRSRANAFFTDRGMDVLVHVERPGNSMTPHCWCGGVAGQLASPAVFSPVVPGGRGQEGNYVYAL